MEEVQEEDVLQSSKESSKDIPEESSKEIPEQPSEEPSEEPSKEFDMNEILNGYRYSKPDDSFIQNKNILKEATKETNPGILSETPSVFPKEIMQGVQNIPPAYFEGIRQRHEQQQTLPPFIPIYVPVVVPVYMDKAKNNQNVESKVCSWND